MTNLVTINSQQSSSQRDVKYGTIIAKYSRKPHSYMFIDDFCNHYSSTLTKHISEENFFKIDNNEKLFISIFGYNFLRYDLDKLLSNITINLILFGKAYVERVYNYNNGNLVGVYYKCVNCKKIKNRRNYITYKLITDDKKKTKGRIQKKTIIVYRLRDVGFSKKFFRRKLKKLEQLELPKVDVALSKYFDIDQFTNKSDYNRLKIMKGIHWNTRKYDNKFVTEPYLIYRHMMFEKLRTCFLEYLITKINEDIDSIKHETKYTGKIIFESIAQNYDTLITQLERGEKNCEQVGNIIFKGI